MKPTFTAYSEGCVLRGLDNIYDNEEAFNRAYGIQTEEPVIPFSPKPKIIEPSVAKPKPIKKSPRVSKPTRTAEEAKAHKIQTIISIREDRKAKGLTVRGTPRKDRSKTAMTDDELRVERALYMRNYRTKCS